MNKELKLNKVISKRQVVVVANVELKCKISKMNWKKRGFHYSRSQLT